MNMPEHAKLVYKGIMYDIYQWEQELFDGSKTTYEGLKRRDSTQVLVVDGDHLLLAYEKQPLYPLAYGLFGGHIDDNEEPLDCAKRELLEETGMVCESWKELMIYNPVGRIEWKIHLFIAKNPKKIQERKEDPGEYIEVHRVNFEEFMNIIADEHFRAHELLGHFLHVKSFEPKKVDNFKSLLFE